MVPNVKRDFFLLSLLLLSILFSFSCNSIVEDLDDNITEEIIPILERKIIADYAPYHQSFAIYGDYVFFVNDSGNCYVYNIKEKRVAGTMNMDHNGLSIPHGNVTCFGNKSCPESEFPLLYVSQWNGEGGCLVYELSKRESGAFESTLKQTILFRNCDSNMFGSNLGDWVVDTENGYIYSFKYHLDSSTNGTNNYNHICRFSLPSIEDGEVIIFEDSDIQDAFSIPFLPYMQDKKIKHNLLFVASGADWYPQIINIIDLKKKKTVKTLDLSYWGGEPEGLDVSNEIVLSYEGDRSLYSMIYD